MRSIETNRPNGAGGGIAINPGMTRRTFIKASAALIAAAAADLPLPLAAQTKPVEARYYERLEQKRIRCLLCPRECLVGDGERGFCRVRENRNGAYHTLVYARPCAIHLDPIEKKPFFHVLPGTQALSLATVGCNLTCKFCQNWQISQSSPEDAETENTPPSRIVEQALTLRTPSVAFTYGEPIVFIEYAEDIARLARQNGLRSVVVSNGYIRKDPLLNLCGLVDAIKVDLKAFEESYYRDICGATLQPVLDTILQIRSRKVWLELVYLVVPTLNDDEAKIADMARWVSANLGPDVPLHFSRFYPQYRLENLPPTPVSTLDRAYEICRAEGLHYVYVGNVPGHRAESTFCPKCSKKVITRSGYRLESLDVVNGKCRFCGHEIPGIWREA
ncbi:MAG: AmmeMemoRadiSam system radical SAM enzyme [Candidatus Krumholzibacteria bacterium]|nr:AmmeMemoRadiSam system radical SAM enzyme [Candidatus Krumholzibacteria bacterium]